MTCLGRLLSSAALASALALGSSAVLPLVTSATLWSATAQVSMDVFESELAPYGAWIDHPRYGRVWTPTNMPQDWRPYTTGRWEWTDEDGWYWQASEPWGWIPFHYGRWFLDNQFGWLWVPGFVWGPAWVNWRETEDGYLGWAPLPPDDLDFADAGPGASVPAPGPVVGSAPVARPAPVYDNPAYWTFVPEADFGAPNIYQVRVPPPQVQIYLPRTRITYRADVRVQGDIPRGFNRGFDRAYIERLGRRPIVVRREPPRFVETEIIRRRGPNAPELRIFRDTRAQEANRLRDRNVQIRNQQQQIRDQRQQIQNQQQRLQDQRQQNQNQNQNRQNQQRQQEQQQNQLQQQREQMRQQEQQRQQRQPDQNQRQQRQQEQQQNQQQRLQEQRRQEQQQNQQQQRRQEQQQQNQQQRLQEQRRQEQQQQEQRQQRQQEQRREERQQQRQQEQQQQRRQGQQDQRQQRQNRACPDNQQSC